MPDNPMSNDWAPTRPYSEQDTEELTTRVQALEEVDRALDILIDNAPTLMNALHDPHFANRDLSAREVESLDEIQVALHTVIENYHDIDNNPQNENSSDFTLSNMNSVQRRLQETRENHSPAAEAMPAGNRHQRQYVNFSRPIRPQNAPFRPRAETRDSERGTYPGKLSDYVAEKFVKAIIYVLKEMAANVDFMIDETKRLLQGDKTRQHHIPGVAAAAGMTSTHAPEANSRPGSVSPMSTRRASMASTRGPSR